MSIGQSKVRQGGSFWRDWGIVVGGLNDIGNGSSDFKAQCSLVNNFNDKFYRKYFQQFKYAEKCFM